MLNIQKKKSEYIKNNPNFLNEVESSIHGKKPSVNRILKYFLFTGS